MIFTFFLMASPSPSSQSCAEALAHEKNLIEERTTKLRYPEIPSIYELRLIEVPPPKEKFFVGSFTWHHPIKRILYESGGHEDFKILMDAVPLDEIVTEESRAAALADLQAQMESSPAREPHWLEAWLKKKFSFRSELAPVPELTPKPYTLASSVDPAWANAWAYADDWSRFLRTVNKPHGESTIIDLPYPFLIAAGRFQEWYYWDNWPAILALIRTGRIDLAIMQIENFLEAIRHFGFIPNGGRTYYLTRSQPPVIYRLVKALLEELLNGASPEQHEKIRQWIKRRALPLLAKSHMDRWRNPELHHHAETGLAHWWSEVNLPRPEKHGKDDDRSLGQSFRSVRAACESGRDFTSAFEGCADDTASVFLNSLLFEAEETLAWMSQLIGDTENARIFSQFARERRESVLKYLWNSKTNRFENLFLDSANTGKGRRFLSYATPEAFAPYMVRLVPPRDVQKIRALIDVYDELLTPGGVAASNIYPSIHQWDGANTWAPDQLVAAEALANYGYAKEAQDLALRFNSMIRDVHLRHGAFYERYHGESRDRPAHNGLQYPVQEGFLWTNATFILFGLDYLDWQLAP